MIVTYFSILALSLSFIIVIIIGGAIASRKWELSLLSVSFISFLSVGIYLATGYWAANLLTPMAGITIVGLIGLFEATIGLKLAQKFKTNVKSLDVEMQSFLDNNTTLPPNLVLLMVCVYLFIGWLGTSFV
ncbi:hypothetical protein [Aureispira sp. CCB-QB1]|uniref:hypothetical protein n=1 Tax=Aureispira sp. CCB-QB1 TaxID=1313421 RepID=UPI00069741B5|nr:hypothetical protein [Aureispira sp. CCB-QB1]